MIYDWSVLWFTDSLGQTQAVGGLGYAAFAAAMLRVSAAMRCAAAFTPPRCWPPAPGWRRWR
ncbi:hypothetical protein [Rubrivivax gelatinosus]|uniref:hypothetical protein n=1 Tax=Rubrivivax gelatinosus TaxID=28068 RepID=UPI00030744FB|nr:hypothetical protein [Rubrivivax gelatinosus]